ncbi:MAG: hypothetical protein KKB50_05290 [Planctomycetes bacterium]|nr:hypothetical protein [Planctomycetota bacterium]
MSAKSRALRLGPAGPVPRHTALLARIRLLPEVRIEKVSVVRRQLRHGTYDCESRLDEILDDLAADIGVTGRDPRFRRRVGAQ